MDTSKQERKYNEALAEEKKIEKIINEINKELSFFSGEKMTNDGAIRAYENILKIVNKYFDREEFEKHYCEEYRSLYEEKFQRYDKIIEITDRITKEKEILEAGRRGEIEIQNDVKLFSDKIKMLYNCHFIAADIDVEIDMIIVSTKGIFCIEVKNWGEDAELTEKGYLKSKRKNIDVAGRLRRHQHCLRRMLETVVDNELVIKPILLWQNNKSKIDDKFGKVPICYKNTLEEIIFKGDDIFSNNEIELIYTKLKDSLREERKYDTLIDKKFIEDLEYLLTKTFKQELEQQKEIRERRYKKLQEKKNHPFIYTTKNIGKAIGAVIPIVLTAVILKDDN